MGVSRGIHTRAINNYLMGLSLRAGMIVWRTGSEQETVSFVVDQYRMWTEKKWEEHTCHEQIYAPAGEDGRGRRMTLQPRRVPLREKVAAQLPGIDSKARAVGKWFKTTTQMVGAEEENWARLPWVGKDGKQRRLGKVVGGKVWRMLREE